MPSSSRNSSNSSQTASAARPEQRSETQLLTDYRQPYDVASGPPAERDPVLEFALRWWWLLALGVLLGVVVAVAYSKMGPVTYESTALVQVSANTNTDPTDKAGQARSAATNFAAEGESTRMYDLVAQPLPAPLAITTAEPDEMAQLGRPGVGPAA